MKSASSSKPTETWSLRVKEAVRSPPGPPSRQQQLTVISTAISELARNIVRFAKRGEIVVSLVGDDDDFVGVTIVAH